MSKELKTGIVAVFIIAIFIWGFNFLKGKNLFDGNTRYFTVEYNQIGGLSKASYVTINGLKVGKVESINFNENPDKKGNLIVRFSIKDDFQFSKKSIVNIYSSSPLSSSYLAIIPNYEGEMAVDGDLLYGEIESSLFSSIGERLDPLQEKLEHVLVSADTLFNNFNAILNLKTQKSIRESVFNLEITIQELQKTVISVNNVLDASSSDLKKSLANTKNITDNLVKVSDTLATANLGQVIKKAEITLNSVNLMLDGIKKGKGSIGKLVTNEELYNNITTMTKELENLLRELKENPKRFVHFSIFGKKAKPYTPNKGQLIENESN